MQVGMTHQPRKTAATSGLQRVIGDCSGSQAKTPRRQSANRKRTLSTSTFCGFLTSLLMVLTSGGLAIGESILPLKLSQAKQTSIERGLAWLATVQKKDGRFPTVELCQPAVTSLCLMSFMTNGHLPGEGQYGRTIERGLQFVVSCRKANGMLALHPSGVIDNEWESYQTANYNHAISGLTLCEAYGMTRGSLTGQLAEIIPTSVRFTFREQQHPKSNELEGAWRYLPRPPRSYSSRRPPFSDLSVTSWQLMFLRSAKNAGFQVPALQIEAAADFVRRCYDPRRKTFRYSLYHGEQHTTPAMAGAGIVALAQSGVHATEMARNAGHFLLQRDYRRYNSPQGENEQYHYDIFYATLGAFQLGDPYWKQIYPRVVATLVRHQSAQGHWQPENHATRIRQTGIAYTTAMAVLSLSMENQILPIFQR